MVAKMWGTYSPKATTPMAIWCHDALAIAEICFKPCAELRGSAGGNLVGQRRLEIQEAETAQPIRCLVHRIMSPVLPRKLNSTMAI